MNKSYIQYPLILFIVSMICAVIIAASNSVTSKVIKTALDEQIKTSMNSLYDGVEGYELVSEPNEEILVNTYNVATSDGATHYVYQTQSFGKSSNIQMLIGFDDQGVIDAVTYTSINETKGIGDKVESETYINTIIGQEAETAKVDGISGATLSSGAVARSVDRAAEAYLVDAQSRPVQSETEEN